MYDPVVLSEVSGVEKDVVVAYLEGAQRKDESMILEELMTISSFYETLGKSEVRRIVLECSRSKKYDDVLPALQRATATTTEMHTMVDDLVAYSGVDADIVHLLVDSTSLDRDVLSEQLLLIEPFVSSLGRDAVYSTIEKLVKNGRQLDAVEELTKQQQEKKQERKQSKSTPSVASSSDATSKGKSGGGRWKWPFWGKRSSSAGKSDHHNDGNHHGSGDHENEGKHLPHHLHHKDPTALSSKETEAPKTVEPKAATPVETPPPATTDGKKHSNKKEEHRASTQPPPATQTLPPREDNLIEKVYQEQLQLDEAYNFEKQFKARDERPPPQVVEELPAYDFQNSRTKQQSDVLTAPSTTLRNDMKPYTFDSSNTTRDPTTQKEDEDFQKLFNQFMKDS